MTSSKCKIEIPNQLPESGLTRVKFKSWKEGMLVYLKQNDDFLHFLPGGIYEDWKSADEDSNRITALEATETPARDPTLWQPELSFWPKGREISVLCSVSSEERLTSMILMT